jgi:hypothetical protein
VELATALLTSVVETALLSVVDVGITMTGGSPLVVPTSSAGDADDWAAAEEIRVVGLTSGTGAGEGVG